MKNLFIYLIPALLIGCAKPQLNVKEGDNLVDGCNEGEQIAHANIGEILTFKFLINEIESDSLFLEFDNGMDGEFDSLIVTVLEPNNWQGKKFRVHYQYEAVFNDKQLKKNDTFQYSAKVPKCISSLWLFLPPWQSSLE